MSQFFTSGGQSIGTSASVSFLPMTIQGWFPFRLTCLISLLSRDSQHHSSKTSILWCSAFFMSNSHVHRWLLGHSFDYMDLCWQSDVSAFQYTKFVIAFLQRSKCLLISWLQSPSAVIFEPPKIKSLVISIVSPSICHEVMGLDTMILVLWMLSFKPAFSLSSFTFMKRLFNSS